VNDAHHLVVEASRITFAQLFEVKLNKIHTNLLSMSKENVELEKQLKNSES
jgi:hypothetical protein